MLTGQHLSYRVGEHRLLDKVSVSFSPEQLSLIVGANGAGKSTLVRALCGMLPGLEGEVRYGGRALSDWSTVQLARVRAVLSQGIELAFPLRTWEVVMMGRYPHFTGGPEARDERACEEAMRFFDVWDWADRDYLTLSGGERQRVHFARVLSQVWYPTPGALRYLVLDEPLTFLDIRYQYDFMHRVRELMAAGDLVVVGIVHDLNLAARFADHLVMMRKGQVLAAAAPQDVLQPALVQEAFGILPEVRHDGGDGRMHLVFG